VPLTQQIILVKTTSRQISDSQTFLFNRPLFTLDTSFRPPSQKKQTLCSKLRILFKESTK